MIVWCLVFPDDGRLHGTHSKDLKLYVRPIFATRLLLLFAPPPVLLLHLPHLLLVLLSYLLLALLLLDANRRLRDKWCLLSLYPWGRFFSILSILLPYIFSPSRFPILYLNYYFFFLNITIGFQDVPCELFSFLCTRNVLPTFSSPPNSPSSWLSFTPKTLRRSGPVSRLFGKQLSPIPPADHRKNDRPCPWACVLCQ